MLWKIVQDNRNIKAAQKLIDSAKKRHRMTNKQLKHTRPNQLIRPLLPPHHMDYRCPYEVNLCFN